MLDPLNPADYRAMWYRMDAFGRAWLEGYVADAIERKRCLTEAGLCVPLMSGATCPFLLRAAPAGLRSPSQQRRAL